MFLKIKLILASLGTVVLSIAYYIFKKRGEEIEELKEEREQLSQELRTKEQIDIVTEYIEDGYRTEQIKIEEKHDEEIKKLYKTSDVPLPPSLLGKLRNVQGLSNHDSDSPE